MVVQLILVNLLKTNVSVTVRCWRCIVMSRCIADIES